ncbi:MAG TPA: FHA domain-containing protein [Solirubrobacteraceae bacterium]|jgi:predicted  nucleic acid-binding Zn-ribbon protein
MESLTSGTMAGSGSFRCQRCGYVLTLAGSDRLRDCPGCGESRFVRASLFSTGRAPREETVSQPDEAERAVWLGAIRDGIEQAGEYLAFEEGEELRLVALTREWTRVGRSLAADVRFDDPTVSRRHALIVRQPDGVRVLDDRSLNGVFVNGERIEWRVLQDGDEIVVGRYRLAFLSVAADEARSSAHAGLAPPAALHNPARLHSFS